MSRKTYTNEFKKQIIEECQLVGNASLVARRHDISVNTVHSWIRTYRKNGSTKSLPKDTKKKLKETSKRLEKLSTENDKLKQLLAEKELELSILRDLRDQVNP